MGKAACEQTVLPLLSDQWWNLPGTAGLWMIPSPANCQSPSLIAKHGKSEPRNQTRRTLLLKCRSGTANAASQGQSLRSPWRSCSEHQMARSGMIKSQLFSIPISLLPHTSSPPPLPPLPGVGFLGGGEVTSSANPSNMRI